MGYLNQFSHKVVESYNYNMATRWIGDYKNFTLPGFYSPVLMDEKVCLCRHTDTRTNSIKMLFG